MIKAKEKTANNVKALIDPDSVKCDSLREVKSVLKVFNENTSDIPRLKIDHDIDRVILGRVLLQAQRIHCLEKVTLSNVDSGKIGGKQQSRDLDGCFSKGEDPGFRAWLEANVHGSHQGCYNLMNMAINVGCGLDKPVGYAGGHYVKSRLKKYSLNDLYKTPKRFREIIGERERTARKKYNPTQTVNLRRQCMEVDFEQLLRAATDATDESCDRVEVFLEKATARFATMQGWRAEQ